MKKNLSKFFNWFLVLFMVVSMVNPVHVHAAAPSLKITNSAGEECDTFYVGEPIYVTAESTSGDWAAMYSQGSENGNSYWFWYYVNGEAAYFDRTWSWENGKTYNIYSTVPWAGSEEANFLPAGTYTIRLENNPSVIKTITIKEPTNKADSLVVENPTVKLGESFKVDATSYKNGAWVALYAGAPTTETELKGNYLYFQYINGTIGETTEIKASKEGEYSVILFGSDDYKNPLITVPVTVDHTWTKWEFDADAKTHSRECLTTEGHVESGKCKFNEGEVTKEPTVEEDGTKIYTCTVCEGSYIENISIGTVVGENVLDDPTCEKPGVKEVVYDSGKKVEVSIAKLGHTYTGKATYDHENHQHTIECITCDEECDCENKVLVENCNDAIRTQDTSAATVTYKCTVCEGEYTVPMLSSDKTVYNFGDEMWITADYQGGYKTWVGLYRKGEIAGTGEGAVTSLFFAYINNEAEPFNLEGATPQRQEDYYHGEFEIRLYDNDAYDLITSISVTINPVVETEVRHEPTCEEDGWADVTYTDGKTGTITATQDETLKALGHAYPEKWSYDGVEHQTHSKTCTNECECEKRTLIEDCTFGEGVVTDEATAEKDGEMTYTCTVCEGTYTEVISKKEIDHVDTVAATCEKTGVETTYYTDGTHSEKVLPAKGHKYSETWTFDGEYYNTHSKTCANECECEKRTLTEECDLSYEMIGGELYQTCETCEGSYAVTVLTTNKTEYDSSEEIIINAKAITSDSWVGIYDRKLTTSTNYKDNPFAKHQGRWYDVEGNNEVTYKLTPGDYTVVLFEDGGHKAVQCVQIKVTGTKLITTDKAEYFLGEDIKVSVNYEPTSDLDWVGMYNLVNTPGDGSLTHYYAYIKNMTDTSSIHTDFVEQKAIDSGSFTFYILKNDGYEFVDYTTVVVWPAIVSVDEEQVPTCETDGWKKVTLADGSKKTITADLDPTLKAFGGHTYSDKWIYDGEDVKTHSKPCTTCTETCGCENAKLTEECTFDAGAVTEEPAVDKPGLMTYSCEVCEGTYTKEIPALTVTNTEVILEAGCEDEGTLRTYYSDGTYKDTVIDALGHDMGYFIVTTEPTCTEFGEATSECSRCDHTEKDVVEKIEHSYVANVTDPTCTEGGYTTYVCDECGDSYTADETEKLDHTYVPFVTEPTCHSKGYTTYTCECGDSYTADEKDMLWHTFTNYVYNNDATTEKNGTETAKCENCTATNTREVEGTKLPTTPEPTLPTLTDVTRVAGADRYDTAFKVADTLKATLGVDKFDAVIVANGTNFADALAGSYLSSKQNAPILMTDKKDANIQKLVDYIKTNLKADGIVFILGGTAAVSDKVEKQLNGFAIERLAGNDRYETNLAILRRAGGVGYNDLLVCTGTNFADSLSASATGQPMLLVGKKLTARQKVFFMETLPETNVVIVGGEGAVNKTVEKELKKAYENVSRLAGSSRYETSVMVADKYFEKPSYAVVALATNFPDGLSGGALAYALKSPLLLTNGQKANFSITAKYTNSQNITAGYVLGGNKLVTDEAKDAIFKK